MFKKFLISAVMAAMAVSSQAALFTGSVTSAEGPVEALLTANGAIPLPISLQGEVTFDGGGNLDLLVTQVSAFFFTNDWSGVCNIMPPGADCMYGSHPINPTPTDMNFSEVPITNILTNTLVLDGNGIPTGGELSFDAFSPTFGFTLGIVTLNATDGTFGLDAGILGSAAGTIEFTPVPVPAAVWMFGSALLGLFGMRRRS